MASNKTNNKVVPMRRLSSKRTAKLLLAIIVLYIIIFGLITFSKKPEKVYEVQMGSLASDNSFRGVIIRQEEVVNSEFSGNLNFYIRDNTRVKKGDIIYTVDETGKVSSALSEISSDKKNLSPNDLLDIKSLLNSYKTENNLNSFGQLYSLKSNLESMILRSTNQMLIENLDSLIEKTGTNGLFKLVPASKTGIVEFTTDGYESYTLENFNSTYLDESNYRSTNLYSQSIAVTGSPVYRLVTGETWNVVFPLTSEIIERYSLNNKTELTISFKKNKLKASAGFSIINKEGVNYGVLELKDYMIRFSNDRYLDFEILSSTYDGLKIPTSSIVEKDFFVIPVGCILEEPKEKKQGFYCQYYNDNGAVVEEFISPTIVYQDSEYYYIKSDNIKAGYNVKFNDSDDTFTISEKRILKGVYCVNNGYTNFKRIEIIDAGKEYCILKKVQGSISIYDRILLNAEGFEEGVMIY